MKKEKNERSKDETEPIEQNEIAQDEDPPCGLPLPCTQSVSSTGPAISIENTATSGPADGVQGISHSPSASGVFGNNLATAGFANGVFGASTSPDGRGVDGLASHPTGQNFGVRGQSNSTNGRGVFGLAIADSGPADGVFGESRSNNGFGIHGVNSKDSELVTGGGVLGEGSLIGVLGRGRRTGVRGESEEFAVLGESISGRGVTGNSTNGHGVVGISNGINGYGGYFRNTAGGAALQADGDLIYSGRLNKLDVADNFTAIVGCADFTMGHSSRRGSPGRALVDGGDSLHINYVGDWSATLVDSKLIVGGNVEASDDVHAWNVYANGVFAGAVTAGIKLFKIDHPLDPANKYLTHACVESAEMMNVYTGNIVLDANGEVWVELPEWFEALNRDFRYQLTAIGAPAPNLHVAQEIEGNRFKIAGGDPGGKVSWQVTGIRRDTFAEKYPFSVEEEKLAEERGYYLHPEVFGQPKEKSIEWARHPRSDAVRGMRKALIVESEQ